MSDIETLLELEKEYAHLAYIEDGEALRRYAPYDFQMKFLSAGSAHVQRLLMAGNRVGKTFTGAAEMAYHLTGEYPEWWKGRRFDNPVDAWCGSDSSETTRDIMQVALFGPISDADRQGTGTIPRRCIVSTTPKQGTPGAYGTAIIRHISGENSTLGFKSYDQGRMKWQGTKKHVIWLDEEPPEDIYSEAVTRTLGADGITYLTFTPLKGMSSVVKRFVDARGYGDEVTVATWDDAPHLDTKSKKELWSTLPPHQRDARARGIPAMGAGLIYPVDEAMLVVDDFELAEHLPRMYGMDVGWNRTAAVWAAWDRENDIVYLYGEHYVGLAEPPIHAAAVQARGKWIPGVIDPAARGRSQKDGEQLLEAYKKLGLNIRVADNAVEAGIHDVWVRMATGRLKVFKSCRNFLNELRAYHRDEKGHIVKRDDHLMDCMRYVCRSVKSVARVCAPPRVASIANGDYNPFGHGSHWGAEMDGYNPFGRN